jgi:hypothetical protein
MRGYLDYVNALRVLFRTDCPITHPARSFAAEEPVESFQIRTRSERNGHCSEEMGWVNSNRGGFKSLVSPGRCGANCAPKPERPAIGLRPADRKATHLDVNQGLIA